MKNISYLLLMFLIVGLIACETGKEPSQEFSPVYPICGEWWVTYKVETSPGVFDDVNNGYTKLLTYNTAENTPDSIWVEDQGNFWTFKVKSSCNTKSKTLDILKGREIISYNNISGSSGIYGPDTTGIYLSIKNVKYGPSDSTTISNGKVIIGGGITKGGNKTDSIYMEIVWASDPTTTYICSGVRLTGFSEDNY